MALKEHLGQSDEDVLVTLSGEINGAVKFPESKFRLAQRIVIECKDIERINSEGIQTWLIWFRNLDPRQQIVFRQVPSRLIAQINMIDSFLPESSTIESFVIPYDCDSCSAEMSVLVKRGKDYMERTHDSASRTLFDRELNCPHCKSSMKMSIIESKYFQFLDREPQSAES